MEWINGLMRRGLKNEEGQGLVEYALILFLVVIVVLLMVKGFGGTLNQTYSVINSSVPSP